MYPFRVCPFFCFVCVFVCDELTIKTRTTNSVAGNIARDNAKNLKIEEYNALFGVSEEKEESKPCKYSSPSYMSHGLNTFNNNDYDY